jgi:hypothetical protein
VAIYGPAEIPRVLLVRPDVQDFGLRVMRKFEARFPGEKLFIPAFGGYRSPDEQEQIWERSQAEGFRAARPDGKPYHTVGAALDFQVVGTVQNPDADKRDPRYIALGQIIEAEGFRAGINFRSGLPDPYHADTAEPWDVATARWDDMKKKISSFLASSRWSPSPLTTAK